MSSSDISISTFTNHDAQLALISLEKMNIQDKCDVITVLVAPILFLVSVSLSIYFAVHPMAPMISLTANFSLSLPLMICSSAALVSAITFTVQMIRHEQIKIAFEKGFGQLIHSSEFLQGRVRYGLHPGGREAEQSVEQYREARASTIAWTEERFGETISFQTRDGCALGGYWFKNRNPHASTVILFHGNAMNAEDLAPSWGMYYKNLGFNVLLAEYRGYGISSGEACGQDQEMHAYLDAEAAYKFISTQGVRVDKVVAHGYSLGGVYAAALGYFFKVQNVILDHTFTSFAAVAANVSPFTLGAAARGIESAYKQQRKEADPEIPNANELVTDCFNSLEKVRKMPGKIFVIRGEQDNLMDMKFGNAFVQAKYPTKDAQEQNLLTIEGGHCDFHHFFSDNRAVDRFEGFLMARGLL